MYSDLVLTVCYCLLCSGALVGIMDVISCLVLDSEQRQDSEKRKDSAESKQALTEESSKSASRSPQFVQSLAKTFDTYSNGISYAIEMCSVSARSSIRSLTSLMTQGAPELENNEGVHDKDVEPLAHLLEMMEVCEQDKKLSKPREETSVGKKIILHISIYV